MRKVAAALLLTCWLCPSLVSAQIPVTDAGVLAAVGSVVLALKSILDETRAMMAELTHWSEVVGELQAIAQLVTDIEALMEEIEAVDEGWGQLSDSGHALCSIDEAVSWKSQALQWQQGAFAVARKAQRLLGRGIAVLHDIDRVLNGIIGPTAGAQASSAVLAQISSQLLQLQTMTASFHSASMGKDLIDSMLGIQLVCIHNNAYEHWGEYSR